MQNRGDTEFPLDSSDVSRTPGHQIVVNVQGQRTPAHLSRAPLVVLRLFGSAPAEGSLKNDDLIESYCVSTDMKIIIFALTFVRLLFLPALSSAEQRDDRKQVETHTGSLSASRTPRPHGRPATTCFHAQFKHI